MTIFATSTSSRPAIRPVRWMLAFAVVGVALGGAAQAEERVGPSGATTAEERIGVTAIAINDVARVDKVVGPIAEGDAVFRDETVRTGVDSSAKFVFLDDTNVALGATSSVVLDRFVFDGGASYSKAAVNLAKGMFRFTSGHSPKPAYEIRTGNATIGVRGTILDFHIEGRKTTVTLVEGEARVCGRGAGARCTELLHPGDTAVVTSKGPSRGKTPFSFAAAACSLNAALCEKTPAPRKSGSNDGGFPDGALCGR